MKILTLILTIIFLSNCASYTEKNFIAGQQLNNVPIKEVIEAFGFPDDERIVLEKKVYIWEKSGWIGNWNTKTNTTSYSQGNCRLKIVLDENDNVDIATLDGMTCKGLTKAIKKRFKD